MIRPMISLGAIVEAARLGELSRLAERVEAIEGPPRRIALQLAQVLRAEAEFLHRHPESCFARMWCRAHCEGALGDLTDAWRRERAPGPWVRALRAPHVPLPSLETHGYRLARVFDVEGVNGLRFQGHRLLAWRGETAVELADQGSNARPSPSFGRRQGRRLQVADGWGPVTETSDASTRRFELGDECNFHEAIYLAGGRVAASGWDGDGDEVLCIWSPTGELLHRLHFSSLVGALTPAPGGLLCGSAEGITRIDASTGARWFFPVAGGLRALAMAPDGRLVAGAGPDAVRVWALDPERAPAPPAPRVANKRLSLARFSPDGRFLAAASWGDGLWLWDALTGALISEIRRGGGGYLVGGPPREGMYLDEEGLLSFLPMRSERFGLEGTLLGPLECRFGLSVRLVFPPARPLFVAQGRGPELAVHDRRTGQQLARLAGPARVTAVAPSAGPALATGHEDGSVCLWDLDTLTQRAHHQVHESRVRALSLAPDGQRFASAAEALHIQGGRPIEAQVEALSLGADLLATQEEGATLLRALDGALLRRYAGRTDLEAFRRGDPYLCFAREGHAVVVDREDRTLATLPPLTEVLAAPDGRSWVARRGQEMLHFRLELT